ncbi:hypothetical protein YC2023_043846 [Brassica napus]
MGCANMEKKWVFSLLIASLVCGFLIVTYFNMSLLLSSLRPPIVETSSHSKVDNLPRFAYLVSGSKGDLESLWRTLRALYHPRNQYIVHMDLESPFEERLELASRVSNDSMYSKIGIVYMITKANLVSYTGPTITTRKQRHTEGKNRRISLDGSLAPIRGVYHLGLGQLTKNFTHGDAHMSPEQLLKLIAADEEGRRETSLEEAERSLTRLSESGIDLTKKAYDF